MNYSSINNGLLSGKIPDNLAKTVSLYKYLIQNNVAYLFSVQSKEQSDIERAIIAKGKQYQHRYFKTLALISKISERKKINPIIIKTIKWLGEVVDGDIDLIVRHEELKLFLDALSQMGFLIIYENEKKAICCKKGYCKIEPRTVIEYGGEILFDYAQVKSLSLTTIQGKSKFLSSSPQLDNLLICLNCIYGPKYLRFYDYLQILRYGIYISLILPKNFINDSDFINRKFISRLTLNYCFPAFPPLFSYMYWWLYRVFPKFNLTLWQKIKMPIFYLYSRLRVIFNGSLVHQHEWI